MVNGPYDLFVAQGALWMDQVAPDWFQKISIEQLNLEKYQYCPIGQYFGERPGKSLCNDPLFALAHGFALPTVLRDHWLFGSKKVKPTKLDWLKLNAAWIHAILRRRYLRRMEMELLHRKKGVTPNA